MINDLTIYNQYASQMQTGDTLLYIGNSIIGKSIAWWVEHVLLRGNLDHRLIFTHGNMVLRFQEYEVLAPKGTWSVPKGLESNRRWILDARASGVYPVYLSTYLEKYDGSVYWFPLRKDFIPMIRTAIGKYAMSLAGDGYDFLGLFKNMIGLVSADVKRLFCTESIFLSYREGGHIVTGDKAPRPDMVPFLSDPGGKSIFEQPIKLF